MPKHYSPSTIAPPLSRYKVTGEGADVALFRDVRDRTLGAAKPASTLIIVAGLARPEYLVEIEAIAAAD
jgi:enamine deaminase RidA (YjgF/YER057c/UK114 family)